MLTTLSTAIAVSSFSADFGFRTLTLTCSKAIDGISYFMNNKHPSFLEWNELLEITDISVKLRKIEQLSKEFKEKEDTGFIFKGSIKMAISDVDNAVVVINGALEQAIELYKYHQSLYWHTWRSVDCSSQIRSLNHGVNILQKRFDDLSKIILMTHNIER